MLNEGKITQLQNYIFKGFPETKGKIGVRVVDPPVNVAIGVTVSVFEEFYDERLPSGYTEKCYYKERNSYIDNDLEEELCRHLDQDSRDDVKQKLASGMGIFSAIDLLLWTEDVLNMHPSCVSIAHYWGADGGHHRVHSGTYYITQWHGSLSFDEKLSIFSNGSTAKENFKYTTDSTETNVVNIFNRVNKSTAEEVFDYFCVAHEFAHALQKNNEPVEVDYEAVCDTFAAISTVANFGDDVAIPVLKVINDMRIATQYIDKEHATSPALSVYLSQNDHPSLNAKEALCEAQRIVSEKLPALYRSSGRTMLKLV